jgi:hypothetical protein
MSLNHNSYKRMTQEDWNSSITILLLLVIVGEGGGGEEIKGGTNKRGIIDS